MHIVNDYIHGFKVQPYRRNALKSYYGNYSKDNLTVLTDTAVKEVVERQGFFVEETPRSIYKVQKLYDALSSFSPVNAPYIIKDEHLASGVSLAWKCFGYRDSMSKLRALPMMPTTVSSVTSNPSGSAGLTWPGKSKKHAHTRALERGIQILKGEKSPEPCLAFKRTQKNDKTRLVWGFPYSMTVIEGLVAYPLNNLFKKGNTPMAYGITSLAMGSRIRSGSRSKQFCYSLDMSQFDASIASYLIKIAFNILRSWFDLEAIEPVTGVSIGHVFNIIEKYFVTTPIVMPNGKVYLGKRHGVPSGSYFTQIVDSIVNTILCGVVSSRYNLGVNRRDVMVLGDDLLFFSNRKVNLDKISKFVKKNLGINVHGSEKSYIYKRGDTIHFLGRDWKNGYPDISVDEIVQKMVYPESYRKYSKEPSIKTKQIHLLLLSYASVYRSAWRIAEREINPEARNVRRGEIPIDTEVYLRPVMKELIDIDPTMLSGLTRYRKMYTEDKQRKKVSPFSGGQYLR